MERLSRMSRTQEIAKAAPQGQLPGFFVQMKTPTLTGGYIIFHGDEGELGPSIVLPRGDIVVLDSLDAIRDFTREQGLIDQDVEEILDMHALASSSATPDQVLKYQSNQP